MLNDKATNHTIIRGLSPSETTVVDSFGLILYQPLNIRMDQIGPPTQSA